jgi:hypothetical protein
VGAFGAPLQLAEPGSLCDFIASPTYYRRALTRRKPENRSAAVRGTRLPLLQFRCQKPLLGLAAKSLKHKGIITRNVTFDRFRNFLQGNFGEPNIKSA